MFNARNVGSLQIYVVNRISWKYVFYPKNESEAAKGYNDGNLGYGNSFDKLMAFNQKTWRG